MRRSARRGSSTHSMSGSHIWAIKAGSALSSACLSISAAPAKRPSRNCTFSCDIARAVSRYGAVEITACRCPRRGVVSGKSRKSIGEESRMADAALFIGWGQVVRGREKRAVQVFNESVEYWGGLQGDGKIEDFEVVLLTPHGGDLQGFALLRGSEDQISALRADEEFQRRVARADLIVESQGVIDAAIGEGIARGMSQYQGEVDDLD